MADCSFTNSVFVGLSPVAVTLNLDPIQTKLTRINKKKILYSCPDTGLITETEGSDLSQVAFSLKIFRGPCGRADQARFGHIL